VVSRILHRQTADPAAAIFDRACTLGLPAGCGNVKVRAEGGNDLRHSPPRLADYPFVLREGKGTLPDRTPRELYARACRQGWQDTCRRVESE
jgi:hypothetical protein